FAALLVDVEPRTFEYGSGIKPATPYVGVDFCPARQSGCVVAAHGPRDGRSFTTEGELAVLDVSDRPLIREYQNQVRGLGTELPPDAATRQRDHCRVAPFAIRRLHDQHAAPAPPAD